MEENKKKTEADEYLINWVCDYITKNYSSFNSFELHFLDRNNYGKSLGECLNEIRSSIYNSTYIINEFIGRYRVDVIIQYPGWKNDDFFIYKINDKYIKYEDSCSFVEPKYKQVLYFE